MATTTKGARLTVNHRREQLSVRAAALKEIVAAWELLDPFNIDQTAVAWLRLMLGITERHHGESVRRAQSYYVGLRGIEVVRSAAPVPTVRAPELIRPLPVPESRPDVVPEPPRVVRPEPVSLPREPELIPTVRAANLNRTAVANSLLVTGPVGIKKRVAQGMEPEQAKKIALVETSGAAGRHILNGGRDAIVESVEQDPVAVGFARVPGPNCCAFCALLATRGYVYKSRTSALFVKGTERRYHDHCACAEEPAFEYDTPVSDRVAELQAIYNDSAGRVNGDAKRAVFAQALKERRAST